MLGRLFSLIGLSWGNGGVEMFNADVPVSFPPYGTIIATYNNYEYPVSQGGSYTTYNSVNYPSQTVTIDLIADGLGGSILNWSNIRDIAFKPYGTYISYNYGNSYVNIYGNDYINGTYSQNIIHDGYGGYTDTTSYSYNAYGTLITYIADPHAAGSLEVPTGSGNFFPNATVDGYDFFNDGYGGYYQWDAGAYTSYSSGVFYTGITVNIEVPSGSGNWYPNGLLDSYFANGSYGYYLSTTGSPYAYGTFIATGNPNQTEVPAMSGMYYNNGSTNDYVADGMGGYTTNSSGTYYSLGTIIKDSISSGGYGSYIDIPSGNGMYYFYDQWSGDRYVWDGAGGYYQYSGQFYYAYGTYIYNDGVNNWYWDGSGGYYST